MALLLGGGCEYLYIRPLLTEDLLDGAPGRAVEGRHRPCLTADSTFPNALVGVRTSYRPVCWIPIYLAFSTVLRHGADR